MAPGDHLSTAGETVEELSAALPEFTPGGPGTYRDEARRPVAEGVEHVEIGAERYSVPARVVPAWVPVAVVCHGDWLVTDG